MSLASRAVEFLARFPPAHTRDVAVRRDIEIVMPDGVTLRGDRYWARGDGFQPIIVMRSPYGRTGIWALGARVFAERGYHETSIQDILDGARIARGTFYLYFDSKRAIFDELVDDFLRQLQGVVTRVDLSPGAEPPLLQTEAHDLAALGAATLGAGHSGHSSASAVPTMRRIWKRKSPFAFRVACRRAARVSQVL